MNATGSNAGRLRACRDRCEVCNTVLVQRPVANRRRCADHLDQLVLVPASAITKNRKRKEGFR